LSKYDEVVTLLNERKYDVFGLCETFLDSYVAEHEFNIKGYSVITKHRNKHGGGVLFYIHEAVRFEVIDMNVSSGVESLWINMKCTTFDFAVGVMYRPPSANSSYLSDMLDQLDFIHAHYDKVILMGDLNFDYKPEVSVSQCPIHNIETFYSMKQLITDPTRVTVTTSTLLDVIISNVPQLHVTSGVYEISVSDHYLVFTVLQLEKTESNHKTVTFRNYRNFKSSDFINDLLECDAITNTEWSSDLLEEKWGNFKEEFLKISNKHVPIETRRLKNRNNPWITPEIVELMYERDYVKKKAVKLKDNTLWCKYVSLRNKITQLIRQRKRNYTTDMVNEHKNNPSKLWKTLNKISGRDTKKNSPINIDADKYNSYFNSIGRKTVSHLEPYDQENIYWKCNKSIYSFEFQEVSTADVEKHLMQLGDECTMDVLEFDGRLLYRAAKVVSPFLCKCFNVSLAEGLVLSDWKLSRITPVYKGKGSRNDECNYRPISVICHIAKILEKLIQTQVMNYLDEHELITADQSAYLKNHNTQTSLHRVIDDWLWNFNDNLITAVCALDISKCFDTINHAILIKKLEYYGFNENTLKWFRSYLGHRGHKVFCNNKSSDINHVNIGVPQGSVLGPTLFLLYINDINNSLGSASCNIYADDVLLYCAESDVDEVNSALQESLDNIKNWYDNNLLVVNASKSNAMIVTTRQKETHLVRQGHSDATTKLKIDEIPLINVACFKYLGVTLDKNLSWDAHINALCKELNGMVWILTRLRQFLSHDCLMHIYQSLVQPKLDYGITIWGYGSEKNIGRVQRMQNRIVRGILNNYDFINCRGIELVSSLNIFNVTQRRDYFMSVTMFKCIHGLAPAYMCNEVLMAIEVSEKFTRNVGVNDLYVPNVMKECTKNSFSVCGPKIWNSLPEELKACDNLSNFKTNAKFYFKRVRQEMFS